MLLARLVPASRSRHHGCRGFAERLERRTTHQQVVLIAQRERRIDQIMPRALLAELDFQTVGEEERGDRRGSF